jgi:hypothetical protein
MHTIVLPEWADELTPAQRAVLEPAFYYGRPLVRDDGSVIRPLVDVADPPFRYQPQSAEADLPDVDPETDPATGMQGGIRVVPHHDRGA